MNGPVSIDWRRGAFITLCLALHGVGWLLIHGGRLMQSCGGHFRTAGIALNLKLTRPRRK